MAENENGQEKTEDPTAKRLRESREKGQVARSRELNSLALTSGSAIVFLVMGSQMADGLGGMMRQSFVIPRSDMLDASSMYTRFVDAFFSSVLAVLPILIATVVLAIAASIALGGWNFSSQAITPQFNRLNPISGFKRMFSLRSLVELIKTIAKFGLILGIAIGVFFALERDFIGLGLMDSRSGLARAGHLLTWAFLLISLGLLVIALIDVPFQLYEHKKNLRMTKQEVKDEFKETEGKPEVKQKIRQLQMQMAQRRMMEAVPEADVVVTNPTHFAVALKYSPEIGEAPIVVAKGADEMALRIRRVAAENGVLIFEAPPLARSLYAHVELEHPIPAGLYTAVAQVLAYVFQLRTAKEHGTPTPDRPDPEVPKDWVADAEGRRQENGPSDGPDKQE